LVYFEHDNKVDPISIKLRQKRGFAFSPYVIYDKGLALSGPVVRKAEPAEEPALSLPKGFPQAYSYIYCHRILKEAILHVLQWELE